MPADQKYYLTKGRLSSSQHCRFFLHIVIWPFSSPFSSAPASLWNSRSFTEKEKKKERQLHLLYFPLFYPTLLFLSGDRRVWYQTCKFCLTQGLIKSALKSMEKFLRIWLFSRLFPAPLWLWPFDCTGMQGGCGSSEGRIFSKAAHKRESCLLLQSMRLLRFPLGPNLQFICFPMLHSHCNTPPARHCAESEAKFFLAAVFSSHLWLLLPGPPQPSFPQVCPSQSRSDPLPHLQHILHLCWRLRWMLGYCSLMWLWTPNQSLLCHPVQLHLPLSLKQCHFFDCIFTKWSWNQTWRQNNRGTLSAQKESIGGNSSHLTQMASAWELWFGKNMEIIIAFLIFKGLFIH